MITIIRRPQRRVRSRASSTTVILYSVLLRICKMLLGRPGASKIIQPAIPSMCVVGLGATKMFPQGTISLFRGLCEPFLYAKFRDFDAFKWFSGFPTLILKHFGTQNRSPDDICSCFVWKNRGVHIPSLFWRFFRAKHSIFLDTIKSIIIETIVLPRKNNDFQDSPSVRTNSLNP